MAPLVLVVLAFAAPLDPVLEGETAADAGSPPAAARIGPDAPPREESLPLAPPPPPVAVASAEAAPYQPALRESRTESVLYELGAGLGGLFGGALVGNLVGQITAPGGLQCQACLEAQLVLSALFGVGGVSLGVYVAGDYLEAGGAWWASLAGSVAGAGVSAGLIAVLSGGIADTAAAVLVIIGILVAPIVGATVGYELSANPIASEVRISLAPTERGGVAVGLSGRF